MEISLIAAVAENKVIGKNNDLPWKLPDDMRFFMEKTKGHYVIMGRKNYDSLHPKFKPLPNRTNIVVTRQQNLEAPGCIVVNDVNKGIDIAKENHESELFIIGGAEIYKLTLPTADRLYITEVKAVVDGDTYFPDFDKNQWKEVSRQPHPADDRHRFAFDIVVYEKEK